MDRRVTSPIWGPPTPCKQALISSPLVRRHENKECTKAWYEIRSQAKRRGREKEVVGHFKTSLTSSVTLQVTNVAV